MDNDVLILDAQQVISLLQGQETPIVELIADAYLAHPTLIEILTVLVAQRVGEPAVQRLRSVREALQRHGVDIRTHPLQSWDGGGVVRG